MNQENNKKSVITELEGKIDVTTLGNFNLIKNYKIYDSVKFIKTDGETVTIDNLAVNTKFIGDFNHYVTYMKLVDLSKVYKHNRYNMVSQFKAQKKIYTDDLVSIQLQLGKTTNIIMSAFLGIGAVVGFSALGPYSIALAGAAGYFTMKSIKNAKIEKEYNESLTKGDNQLVEEFSKGDEPTKRNKMKR